MGKERDDVTVKFRRGEDVEGRDVVICVGYP